MYKVPVYDEFDRIVARVKFNKNLDYWDGRNWSNGGFGKHKGLTRLKDGSYVLIYSSDWQGDKDYGVIISPETALREILQSGNLDLLELKKFSQLKEMYNQLEEEMET